MSGKIHDLPERISATLRLIGKKWAVEVLHKLQHAALGFGELQDEVEGISTSVLADLLNNLQEWKIIEKRTISQNPEKHSYFISEFGNRFCRIVDEIDQWDKEFVNINTSVRIDDL